MQLLPRLRRTLPAGVTIDQIAAALEAVTTARVSDRATVMVKGTETQAHGDGLIDFSRNIESHHLAVDGRQIEHFEVGGDTYHRLSADRQQATGKVWLWERGCPYGQYWIQLLAAVRHIASCTSSGADVLAGEPVHRYSFSVKPRRKSFLIKLLGREKDPSLAKFRAHLLAHGSDRLTLDVWLGEDQAVRKVSEHRTALKLALLDGRTNVVEETREYWDFGVRVDLAAPPAELVLGHPD